MKENKKEKEIRYKKMADKLYRLAGLLIIIWLIMIILTAILFNHSAVVSYVLASVIVTIMFTYGKLAQECEQAGEIIAMQIKSENDLDELILELKKKKGNNPCNNIKMPIDKEDIPAGAEEKNEEISEDQSEEISDNHGCAGQEPGIENEDDGVKETGQINEHSSDIPSDGDTSENPETIDSEDQKKEESNGDAA